MQSAAAVKLILQQLTGGLLKDQNASPRTPDTFNTIPNAFPD